MASPNLLTATQLAPEQTPHDACWPVGTVFGTETEFMSDPDLGPTLVVDAARIAMEAFARDPKDVLNGLAARAATASLGCNTCKLAGCEVNTALQERSTDDQLRPIAETRLDQKVMMLAAAPEWLTKVRVSRFCEAHKVEPTALRQLAKDPELLAEAISSGDLDELMAGVTNRFQGLVTVRDLPELSSIQGLKADKELEAHLLTADNGTSVAVVDATEATDFRGEPASKKGYGIVADKLLSRITETGADGRSMLLHPDNTMLKVLHRTPSGGTVCEVRKSGKDRLVVHIQPATEENPIRVVILGNHGGDASTQRDFLDRMIPRN